MIVCPAERGSRARHAGALEADTASGAVFTAHYPRVTSNGHARVCIVARIGSGVS
jgi:hypothetical protein